MNSLAHKLAHIPHRVWLVVEEVLPKLEESSVASGDEGDLGGSGKEGGGVRERLF